MAFRQYAVPAPGGISYVSEAIGYAQYLLPGGGYFNDTSAAAFPAAGSLVITGFAPTFIIAGTTTTFLTAGTRAGRSAVIAESSLLSFVTALPAVVTETWDNSLTVAPGAGSIVLTGFAPTATANAAVSPGAGAIVFTGFAPRPDLAVAPGAGSIVLTGAAPSPDEAVAPAAGSIVLSGFAPSVLGDGVVSPAAGAIIFTGVAPAIDTTVAPAAGAITLTGFAPTPLTLTAGGPMFTIIM